MGKEPCPQHLYFEERTDAKIEAVSVEVARLEERMDAKLNAVVKDKGYAHEELERMIESGCEKQSAVVKRLDDHETRIEALELKDTKAKANQLDSSKKWIWGVLLAAAAGWLTINLRVILDKLLTWGKP